MRYPLSLPNTCGKPNVNRFQTKEFRMIDFEARRTTMVDTQVRPSDVTKFPIIDAMLAIKREAFVPENMRALAYAGESLDLGRGRQLLEPRTFAKILDALSLESDDVVLDVGAAYGYSSAILAKMVDFVVALEQDEQFASSAEVTFSEQGIDNVLVVNGVLVAGVEKQAPYDVILIEGGVETVSDALINQLKEGGRIAAIFQQGPVGDCRIGIKNNNKISWKSAFNAGVPVLPGFEAERVFEL